MNDSKRVFHTLDGLRGVAAFSVLVLHSPHHRIGLPGAYLAVDLFFALSGFVLAHAYGERLRGKLTPLAFMRVRWIRLFPLFALGMALGALYAWLAIDHAGWSGANILAMLGVGSLFMPFSPTMMAQDPLFPLNIAAWSLFFEMAVNLLYALIAPRLSNRLLCAIILAGGAGVVAAGLHAGSLNIGWRFADLGGGAARVIFSFFAGVGVHRLWQVRAASWLRLPAWMAVAILVAVFAIPTLSGRLAVDLVAVLAGFPLLILAASRAEPAAIVAPIYRTLGLASYAIYILQSPILSFTQSIFDRLVHPGFIERGVLGPLLVWTLVVALALIIDRIYDAPIRRWLTRAFSRSAAAG